MSRKHKTAFKKCMGIAYLLVMAVSVVMLSFGGKALAQITPLTTENPVDGSFGMEGQIPAPPPTEGATIVTPNNGATFNDQPVTTVSGLCPEGLLVKVLVNEVFVGSDFCLDGSFSMQVSLFSGQNDIRALVYDDLDQEGPSSNTVSVTFNNAEFTAFGELITLTSNFYRRAADPGKNLTWPLQLSGGNGPYAVSVNWGDGSEPQLLTQELPGNFNINHVYDNSGIYRVVVRVTDNNGVSAFLQLIAVAKGTPTGGMTVDEQEPVGATVIRNRIIWQPAAVLLLLAIPAFWLGRKYEITELRKKMNEQAEKYGN